MRALFLAVLFTATCLAADLATVTLPTGATWVGYYERAADIVVTLRPRAVLSVPEGARIEPLAVPANETPQQRKDRAIALTTLADHLARKASGQRPAQHGQVMLDLASDARDAAAKINKADAEAAVVAELLEPVAPKRDAELTKLEQAIANEAAAKKAIDQATDDLRIAKDACARKLIEHFKNGDFAPVVVVASTADANQVAFDQARQLNQWMAQIASAKSRGQNMETQLKNSQRSLFMGGSYDMVRMYAIHKKQDWMLPYLDLLQKTPAR